MGANDKPKNVTVYGRLSFPTLTAKEAFELSQKGKYPAADVASAQPHFQVLLEQPMLDKFLTHVENVFIPYCIEQNKKGEKKDSLDAKEGAKLLAGMQGDLSDQVFNTPLKEVHEKTAALAPECVATLKAIGTKGQDIEVKAIVTDESEFAVPDPDQLTFPVLRPIGQTIHSLYPGCMVAVTLNLYAYHNDPKRPGIGAGANVVVFKADADRFGGGVAVDEDEIFAD